jgi:hypothetical protein
MSLPPHKRVVVSRLSRWGVFGPQRAYRPRLSPRLRLGAVSSSYEQLVRCPSRPQLCLLACAPHYRRKGYGSALLEDLEVGT